MSDYTPGSYSPHGGGGCLLWLLALAAGFFMLMAMGGDDTSTAGMDAEVLSRNQINLWSDVRNEYYDCIGAGSCIWYDTTTSTSTTSTRNDITGDRNVMYSSTGVLLCPNPNNPNEWGDVAAWCEAAGVQP